MRRLLDKQCNEQAHKIIKSLNTVENILFLFGEHWSVNKKKLIWKLCTEV